MRIERPKGDRRFRVVQTFLRFNALAIAEKIADKSDWVSRVTLTLLTEAVSVR